MVYYYPYFPYTNFLLYSIEQNQPQSQNQSQAFSNGNHPAFSSIPINKGLKFYTVPEALENWNQNKQEILNHPPQITDDDFKLQNAQPLYHLSVNEISSFNKLSIDDPSNPEDPVNLEPLDVNGNGNANANAPVVPATDSILQSDQINWFYLDSSGNEQGPFNGDLMQGWYKDGYLNLDLKLKRQNGEYQTLQAFCESVKNYGTPFSVPLPANPSTSNPPSSMLNGSLLNLLGQPLAQPLSNMSQQFGLTPMYQPFQVNPMPMPSILQQQINTNPVLSRTNSSWGMNDYSSPSTPLAMNSGLGQLPVGGSNVGSNVTSNVGSTVGSTVQTVPVQVPTPMSPWASAVHSLSRVNSPFFNAESNDQVLNNIHSSVVTGVLDDFGNTPESVLEPEYEPIVQPNVVVEAEDFEAIVQPKVVVPEEVAVPEVVTVEETKVETAPEPKSEPEIKQDPQPEITPVASESKSEPKPVTKKDSSKDKAPWAATKSTPKMSLKEIQQLESQKLEQQKKIEMEIKLENQAKLLKEEKLREEREKQGRPSLPTTTSWASATTSKQVTKTLAEIQREEELKAAESAKLNKQKQVSNSMASTLAAAPVEDGWSTITSTKKVIKKQPSATVLNKSTSASKTNPQVLRSVSSTITPVKVDNSNAIREEFVIWARSQMTNLYPSVSQNDLLEMFISLPNNSDSSQLIAETVYSSSATMNGRVFAQEFLKKRQQTERQISNANDLSAWSQAIILSAGKTPSVDEEGWSTTNKKKKGRRN